jgi:prepilin-type processing-associated H-X9-DG protein
MKRQASLNRYDVPILLLCAGFAWASLGNVGGAGRTRAKDFLCRSHLQQWASIFDSSTQDNDSFFPPLDASPNGRWWIEMLWPYHKEVGLLACPAAMAASSDVPTTHRAWRIGEYTVSYGLNGWIGNRKDVAGHRDAFADRSWQTPRVWGAAQIPVLADMFWADAWPNHTDMPPATEQLPVADGTSEMQLVCVNRHDGAVNVLFMDWSVRKVGLKELWALQWYRAYNTAGPWTVAGGVTSMDWPEWMRPFKEFHEVQGDGDL